jgi:hypothetical protein
MQIGIFERELFFLQDLLKPQIIAMLRVKP